MVVELNQSAIPLAPDRYERRVIVQATDPDIPSQSVVVSLMTRPDRVSAVRTVTRPSAVVFLANSSTDPISELEVTTYNKTGSPVYFTSTAATLEGGLCYPIAPQRCWFSYYVVNEDKPSDRGTSGVVKPFLDPPTVLRVSADTSQAGAGVFHGTIRMQTQESDVSSIDVFLSVGSRGAVSGLAARSAASCDAPIIIFTQVSVGFTARLDEPLPLETYVVDSCGRPATSA